MISIEIKNMGQFMSSLLKSDKFDRLLVTSVEIKTAQSLYINGRMNKEFFDSDDEKRNSEDDFISYGSIREVVFYVIKGKILPLSFRISLCLSKKQIHALSERYGFDSSIVASLGLNIIYENNRLLVTTYTNYTIFTLENDASKAFDKYVSEFISSLDETL